MTTTHPRLRPLRTALRPIRTALRRARFRALGIRDPHPNPYATHLPVLLALSHIARPKTVLELGSGTFSTNLFLDRDAFPDLEKLVSYEDDLQWAKVVTDTVGEEARLDYRVVDRVPSAVPDDLSAFDLVFIDDSAEVPDRAETIRQVLARNPRGLVVIHDFENRHYRAAARGAKTRFIMRTFTPQVGILATSNQHREKFQNAADVLEIGSASNLDLEDALAWQAIMRKHQL